jgi:hypothetical protein
MHDGPWSDKAHVAEQNIQDLGYLIQACPSKYGTKGSNARIAAELIVVGPFLSGERVGGEIGLQDRVAVDEHSSELVQVELTAILPNTKMPVEDGPFRGALDQQHEQQAYR